ncbi:MAG: GrpB family protein [Candidatus Nealsonbacteria bacterium]|nr:MAG: GrpB family protein [Candidatus Nealsonbacteria bacterium]
MIGLQRGKVKLSTYKPEWKKLYKKEEKLLLSTIGKYVLDIQHVGATSIPGVKAKPIIDIAIGVKSLKVGEECIKLLKKLGYEYKGDAGIRGRHFFAKGSEVNRTHYVHIEKLSGELWKNHILFRDYLRKNKKIAKKYTELKKKLAQKYKYDRDTYTTRKSAFIQKILKKLK